MDIDKTEADRLLALIADSIEEGKEFVLDQAPGIAQEIVLYGRTIETFQLVLILLAGAFGLYCIFRAFTAKTDRKWDTVVDSDFPIAIFWGLAAILPCTIGVVGIIEEAPDCMMAWFMPKLYILHFLSII